MIVNFDILKSPINWFTVLLMLLIASIGLHAVVEHYSVLSSQVPKQLR